MSVEFSDVAPRWVFPNASGEPIRLDNLRFKAFVPLRDAAVPEDKRDLKHGRHLYGFRHFAITHLVAFGLNEAARKAWAGHSGDITMNYTHTSLAMLKPGADGWQSLNLLGRASLSFVSAP
jgi:integrase